MHLENSFLKNASLLSHSQPSIYITIVTCNFTNTDSITSASAFDFLLTKLNLMRYWYFTYIVHF